MLLGCGLRRSEVAALTVSHVQQRDERWCIVDLVGKHGRVRTIPMPTWVKVAMDAWTSGARVADGYVFRPVNRAGQAQGVGLSEKVVWQLLEGYAAAAGVAGIAPHDLRRTCAKRCRAAGGELGSLRSPEVTDMISRKLWFMVLARVFRKCHSNGRAEQSRF